MPNKGPEPASASSLIKVGGTNFWNMNDASGINSLRASAPAFHQNIDRALKASGTVRSQDPVVEAAVYQSRSEAKRHTALKGFRNGSPVIDIQGRKLTIIHASAGHTKKTHTPVHRVADREGNTWLEKESKLRLRM